MAADPITASTVDDLLDFDFSDADDPFADKPLTKTRDDKASLSPRSAKRKLDEDKENLGLGLDEEVKIVKKRRPIVKLDEARLLSEPGLPRLRALARSGKTAKKLGFKGKGHEFSDVGRLLSYYQLWLDGLYPRAKFADGLQLIEKAGHSKRMNVMRKKWIDEGKPGYIRRFEAGGKDIDEQDTEPGLNLSEATNKDAQAQDEGNPDDLFFRDARTADEAGEGAEPDDDELDALLAANDRPLEPGPRKSADDSEGEDDLDALLAEQESTNKPSSKPGKAKGLEEDEEAALDALLGEQTSRDPPKQTAEPVRKLTTIFDKDDEDDNDDLDAILAEQEAHNGSGTGGNEVAEKATKQASPMKPPEVDSKVLSSSPLPNNPEEEDDLDALLAEHDALQ